MIPTIEVVVSGDLDVGSVSAVNATLEEAIALQPTLLIIDLAQCPSIDASGVLLLLDVHRRALRNGGSVALRSPTERARRNLRLAHVEKVLQVLATAEADTGTTHG